MCEPCPGLSCYELAVVATENTVPEASVAYIIVIALVAIVLMVVALAEVNPESIALASESDLMSSGFADFRFTRGLTSSGRADVRISRGSLKPNGGLKTEQPL